MSALTEAPASHALTLWSDECRAFAELVATWRRATEPALRRELQRELGLRLIVQAQLANAQLYPLLHGDGHGGSAALSIARAQHEDLAQRGLRLRELAVRPDEIEAVAADAALLGQFEAQHVLPLLTALAPALLDEVGDRLEVERLQLRAARA